MTDKLDGLNQQKENERQYIPYKSKPGFEHVPIIRDSVKVATLLHMIKPLDGFLCGGYIRYMCSPDQNPKPANDIDIYCKSEESYDQIKELCGGVLKLTSKHENDLSITYRKVEEANHLLFSLPPLQIIKPMKEARIVTFGTMQEVLENFDFTVIRIGWGDTASQPLADADFLHDEERGVLRLKNIHCPVSSTLRCMKYSRKGYYLPPFQALRLFLDWENRDDEYKMKLQEFLAKSEEDGGLTQAEVDEMEAMMRID